MIVMMVMVMVMMVTKGVMVTDRVEGVKTLQLYFTPEQTNSLRQSIGRGGNGGGDQHSYNSSSPLLTMWGLCGPPLMAAEDLLVRRGVELVRLDSLGDGSPDCRLREDWDEFTTSQFFTRLSRFVELEMQGRGGRVDPSPTSQASRQDRQPTPTESTNRDRGMETDTRSAAAGSQKERRGCSCDGGDGGGDVQPKPWEEKIIRLLEQLESMLSKLEAWAIAENLVSGGGLLCVLAALRRLFTTLVNPTPPVGPPTDSPTPTGARARTDRTGAGEERKRPSLAGRMKERRNIIKAAVLRQRRGREPIKPPSSREYNNNSLLSMNGGNLVNLSNKSHVSLPPTEIMMMKTFMSPAPVSSNQPTLVNPDTYTNRTEPGSLPKLSPLLKGISPSTPTSSGSDISIYIDGGEEAPTNQKDQGGRRKRGRGGGAPLNKDE